MEGPKKVEIHPAEELLSRFRSKEDLYRYMTLHGMTLIFNRSLAIVNVFLPTMGGTKLSFMRDILSETKKHLKVNEVNFMQVPNYKELSVKNMYEDAIADPVLSKYLPSPE